MHLPLYQTQRLVDNRHSVDKEASSTDGTVAFLLRLSSGPIFSMAVDLTSRQRRKQAQECRRRLLSGVSAQVRRRNKLPKVQHESTDDDASTDDAWSDAGSSLSDSHGIITAKYKDIANYGFSLEPPPPLRPTTFPLRAFFLVRLDHRTLHVPFPSGLVPCDRRWSSGLGRRWPPLQVFQCSVNIAGRALCLNHTWDPMHDRRWISTDPVRFRCTWISTVIRHQRSI